MDGRQPDVERTVAASPTVYRARVRDAVCRGFTGGSAAGGHPRTAQEGAREGLSQEDREESGEEEGCAEACEENREEACEEGCEETRQEGKRPEAWCQEVRQEGRRAKEGWSQEARSQQEGHAEARPPLIAYRSAAARLLALLLALGSAGCREREPEGLALVGATVLDGSGGPPLRDAVIVVRGTRVHAISSRADFKLPRRIRQVDVSGKWIIPGLIDAHAHVAPWTLSRYLAFGVTSVRDVHGTLDTVLALRERVNLGAVAGPRIYSAGAMLDGLPPTYPDAFGVADAGAARRAVDSLVLRGADVLKLYTHIDAPLMRAALDEARTFNLLVTAHLGLTDAISAADLGLRSIEHLSGIPEAAAANGAALRDAHRRGFFAGWTAFERSWASLDSASLARVAAALAERQVILVPTLVLHETFSWLDDSATYSDPALRAVPEGERRRWNTADMIRRAGWTADDFTAFRRARAEQDRFLRIFRAAGGIIVTGTDAANQQLIPGESEHRELELLVRAGVPPEDALLAATRNAALLLGADSIGTIAPGRVADLVVLGGDPHTDIRNTRLIEQVMVRGLLMRGDSLRQGW